MVAVVVAWRTTMGGVGSWHYDDKGAVVNAVEDTTSLLRRIGSRTMGEVEEKVVDNASS